MLKIQGLESTVEGKKILHGVTLSVKPGEVHAIMGPNGSGKSTLAYTLAGHPHYSVDGGTVKLEKQDLLDLSPDERAQAGLFLAFQYPVAVDGVSVQNFLKTAYEAMHPTEKIDSVKQFRDELKETAGRLGVKPELLSRSLNQGFSGGEKKRIEVLQLLTLKPRYAILDETDSGLDIDSIQLAAQGINEAVKKHNTGCLVITHYQRILDYLQPDKIHVMMDGKIAHSGGPELVQELESKGYKHLRDLAN